MAAEAPPLPGKEQPSVTVTPVFLPPDSGEPPSAQLAGDSRERPGGERFPAADPAAVHVAEYPAYEAAAGDGTRGTFTVTGVSSAGRGGHMMTGTFASADRRLVITGMTYQVDPPLSPGATVPAIKPAWNWLGISSDQVINPGQNSAGLPMMAFVGALDLASLAGLSWSAWFLIRTRRPSPPAAAR